MTIAEALVTVAVDLSPAAHRETRREQWLADVHGAAELDLSPVRLACGALTTAVFHRTRHHRSSWGNTMATAITTRPTLGAVPVLTIGIVLSVLVSTAFTMAFGGEHGGGSWQWYRFIVVQAVFGAVLPAAAVVAMLTLLRTPRTRLVVTSIALLAAAVAFGGWEIWALLGVVPVDYAYSMVPTFWGLPTIGLALWCWATEVRGWRWALVLVPVALWAAMLPFAQQVPVTALPLFERLPLLVGVAAGVVASRVRVGGRSGQPETD